jgi:hypothetical protein
MKSAGIIIASSLAGMLIAQTAVASHFRGGAIVTSVDAAGLISFTSTTFWRNDFVDGVQYYVSGTGTSGDSNYNRLADDTADSRFTRVVESWDRQATNGAGTYNFEYNSCCRVSQIANAAQSSMNLNTSITWDGSNANAPILFDFSSINPEVVRGNAYSDSLGALSGNGQALSYDQALNVSITSQPSPSFVVDPTTGQLTIPVVDTTAMNYDNGANAGADYAFSGNIKNADGSLVEFDWLFDAVNTGSSNLAPTVQNLVINVFQGDVLAATVVGTDPENDPLTWNQQFINGLGDTSQFNFNAATQGISWDTTGVTLGQYIAGIRASDGSLTDTGTVTINVLAQPGGNVPEPAILSLFGIGILGMGFIRRRKNK